MLRRDELQALKATIWWDAETQQLIVNGRAGAIDMLSRADAPEALIARMLGGNAAAQFNIDLAPTVTTQT